MSFLANLNKYKSKPICFDINQKKKLLYSDITKTCKKINNIANRRSLVFIVYTNTLDFIKIYLSILKLKIVPLILNENINEKFINRLAKEYRPYLIFYPKKKNSKIKNFSENYFYKKIKKNYYKINKDIALLISTSGTTGSSKQIACSYENLNYSANAISKYLKISQSDKPLLTLPLSYVYGLSVLHSHLLKNSTIYLIKENFLSRKFWTEIFLNKISTFPVVPYQLEILEKINFIKFNLRYIKYLTVAGGKTNLSLLKKIYKNCKNKKIKLFCMYGQAEANSRISYLNPKYLSKKIGSIGKAIPGGKLFIFDKKNKAIDAPNKKGQLVYKGKNIMLGYSNSYKDLKNKFSKNSYLFTGDIGYRDKDNFFYIIGRKARDVKIFGNRINLDEIEEILKNKGINCRCVSDGNYIKTFVTESKNLSRVNSILTNLMNLNMSFLKVIKIKYFPLKENKKTDYLSLSKIK